VKVAATLLERDLSMTLGEREIDGPTGDAVLVKVEWAGLCGSDLHVLRSGVWVEEWPATLGHEVFGEVVEAGPDAAFAVGDRVVLDSRVPCLACEQCEKDPDFCPNITFLGESRPGGFATHVLVPSRSAHAVPDGVQGEDAVLAEPLAVAFHALGHLDDAPRRALVLGHGPIGALIHIELRRRFPDATVAVAEPNPRRAALAEALGATVHGSGAAVGAEGYDLVVEAAGYPNALGDAVKAAGERATVLAVAISEAESRIRPLDLVEGRIRLIGVNAFLTELPEAIAAIASEPWRYRPVVTRAVSLAEFPPAVAQELRDPQAIKLLVRP
jgi:2-desacetyl-2-hydroxyethyl bacteriochlorophyllide A dehydrogenase